jgi:hypothetical protein
MQVHGTNHNDPQRTDVPRTERHVVGRPHLKSFHSVTSGSELADSRAVRSTSPELTSLLEQLQEEPEVRARLLQRVAEKFTNGDYQTRDAARQTALRMLEGE